MHLKRYPRLYLDGINDCPRTYDLGVIGELPFTGRQSHRGWEYPGFFHDGGLNHVHTWWTSHSCDLQQVINSLRKLLSWFRISRIKFQGVFSFRLLLVRTRSSTTPLPKPSFSKTVASNPRLEILAAIWEGSRYAGSYLTSAFCAINATKQLCIPLEINWRSI